MIYSNSSLFFFLNFQLSTVDFPEIVGKKINSIYLTSNIKYSA